MQNRVRLQLQGAIYRPDSFALMPRYCANLKAIRYESTSLNRIVADKSHRVNVALKGVFLLYLLLSIKHFEIRTVYFKVFSHIDRFYQILVK